MIMMMMIMMVVVVVVMMIIRALTLLYNYEVHITELE
jgi:hypothetical protein